MKGKIVLSTTIIVSFHLLKEEANNIRVCFSVRFYRQIFGIFFRKQSARSVKSSACTARALCPCCTTQWILLFYEITTQSTSMYSRTQTTGPINRNSLIQPRSTGYANQRGQVKGAICPRLVLFDASSLSRPFPIALLVLETFLSLQL